MAITLDDLRTYASETASADPSSSSSDREIQTWINDALEEVYLAHDWHWARAVTRVTMVPEETGSYLAVTQGSPQVTLDPAQAERFAEKYLSEGWVLFVDGEGRMGFELGRIDDPLTATLQDGHVWIRATAAAATYTWTRVRYPLPGGALKVYRVEDLEAYGELRYVDPATYDFERSHAPTQRGNRPYLYTVRGGNLELWPGPGSNYLAISVTYKKPAPSYTVEDPGDLVIDWPDDKLGLIRKAILVQASLTHGKHAVVPFERAIYALRVSLERHKAEDSGISELAGPMNLSATRPGGRVDFSRLSGITDSMS